MDKEAYYAYALTRGMDPSTCGCFACCLWRGETPPRGKRKKAARQRGYLWLSDKLDLEFRAACVLAGKTLGEATRDAVEDFVSQVRAMHGGVKGMRRLLTDLGLDTPAALKEATSLPARQAARKRAS